MAPPILRRNTVAVTAASTWTPVHAAVPASRAFVVSKVVVTHNGGTTARTFNLAITAVTPANTADLIALAIPIAAGQVYTETGLVVPAGSFLSGFCDFANGIVVAVFGEEVDN